MSLASLIEPNIALTSLMHGISVNGGKLSFYQHFLFSDNLRTYNLIWLSSNSLQLLSAEPYVFRTILKPNSKKKHRRCMYMCGLCVCVCAHMCRCRCTIWKIMTREINKTRDRVVMSNLQV